jgi:hypothetical protein
MLSLSVACRKSLIALDVSKVHESLNSAAVAQLLSHCTVLENLDISNNGG